MENWHIKILKQSISQRYGFSGRELHKICRKFFSRGWRRCLLLVNKAVTSVTHCSKYKFKNRRTKHASAYKINRLSREDLAVSERRISTRSCVSLAPLIRLWKKTTQKETTTLKQTGLYLQHQYNTMLQRLDKEAIETQRYYEEW